MSDVQNPGGTPKVARVTFHDVTESDDSATERQEPRPMPQGILRRPSNFPFSLKMPFQSLHEDNQSNHDSDSIHSLGESEINRRRPSLAVQIITAPVRWVPNHHNHHQEYRKRKMSLHGKPIYFTVPSKRKSRMLQMRIEAYNFLERPNFKPCSIFYHTFT